MVRRTCKACDHVQVTSAYRRWKCEKCGTWNHIYRPDDLMPPKKIKYVQGGFNQREVPESV